jgi:hypothetical protein
MREQRLNRRMWGIPKAHVTPDTGPALLYERCAPLAGTAAADYLAGRGIPLDVAEGAGVRSVCGKSGRPAALFPVRGEGGAIVACQARYVTAGDDQLTCKSHGPINAGVFTTAGALAAPIVALTEAPIDALSLAACDMPALALCGAGNRPQWLRVALGRRHVLIATDADDAGDAAARDLASWLCFGTRSTRLRPPEPCKDWNDVLAGYERLYQAICALDAAADACRADADDASAAQLRGQADALRGDYEQAQARMYALVTALDETAPAAAVQG